MKSTWNKVREVLTGQRSHEVFVFLFFLGVSFGFWLLQTLNETFEVEVSVPLQLSNVPTDVLITTSLPSKVSVVVHDRGTSLIRFMRDDSFTPIDVDFSRYDNGASSGRVQLQLSEVQRIVQSQLDVTSQILSLRPDTLEFYYNRGLSSRLPVKACGVISASPQHYIQSIAFCPDSVTVYAPGSVLDTMRFAYTQSLSMRNLQASAYRTVPLRTMKGVKYEPDEVEMTAMVGYYTEKTLEIPIIGLNFPADKVLRTFPSKARVTFRVESGRYKNITEDNFVLAATYEELLQNEAPRYRLHLKSMPEGVSNVRISPVEVDYLIEQNVREEQE